MADDSAGAEELVKLADVVGELGTEDQVHDSARAPERCAG